MSVIIMVQPSAARTTARFVRNSVEPPSLVIDDGTSTVVFCPASIVGGLTEAAEFAEALIQAVSEWASGRTIRAALNEAKKRKHITENPATIARAPKVEEEEVEPYSVAEVKRILNTARQRRNGARWAIALAIGLRRGEALGLMWPDIDLDAGTLLVMRSRLRPKWRHGCSEPCRHKFGGYCPQRVPLRDETGSTKSRAGKRGIGLPDPLIELLNQHHHQQQRERELAADI